MVKTWQEVEELGQKELSNILGSDYEVTQTGGFNSTVTDIMVRRISDDSISLVEVKKTPSIAGFQAVVKLDDDGKTFIPSNVSQDYAVQVLCDIINKDSTEKTLTMQEQNQLDEIFLNIYKTRNIKALFYFDTKKRKAGLCSTNDIATNFGILVDKPRNKASGSGRFPYSLDSFIPEMMELQGFNSEEFSYSRVSGKMLIRTAPEAILRANGVKNGKGYGLKEFNGWLPQLSATNDENVLELRKRSKTANPTIIMKLSGIITNPHFPTKDELEKILFG